jgi:hypothetical protein
VLKNSHLIEFREELLKVLRENPNFNRIIDEILDSISELKQNQNIRTIDRIEAKLRFKFACIIHEFKKLTLACNKKYLDHSSQLKLLTATVLNNVDTLNDFIEKNFDDLELEIEIMNLNIGFDTENEPSDLSAIDEIGDVLEKDQAIMLNEEAHEEECYVDLSKDAKSKDTHYYLEDCEENNVLLDAVLLSSSLKKEDELKKNQDLESIITTYGHRIPSNHLTAQSEYTEDIIESVEREIERHAHDLRTDFPSIDKYIFDLRMCMAKDWLIAYEDKFMQYKYGEKFFDSINYQDDKE